MTLNMILNRKRSYAVHRLRLSASFRIYFLLDIRYFYKCTLIEVTWRALTPNLERDATRDCNYEDRYSE
jgi:hypothetical protein